MPEALPLIRRVTTLSLTVEPWTWPFAEQRREEIDVYFGRLREGKPTLWNGKVLLAKAWGVRNETLLARYFVTDYASFLAWRDWGFPDPNVANAFGMGALRSADGHYLLGEMSATTANAGAIYFASGMLDLSDVTGERIDMAANVTREVHEETGLTPDDYAADPAWHVIEDGGRLAMIRVLHSPHKAADLKKRIDNFITRQREPELRAMHMVHSPHDLSPAMPSFVRGFLRAQLQTTTTADGDCRP